MPNNNPAWCNGQGSPTNHRSINEFIKEVLNLRSEEKELKAKPNGLLLLNNFACPWGFSESALNKNVSTRIPSCLCGSTISLDEWMMYVTSIFQNPATRQQWQTDQQQHAQNNNQTVLHCHTHQEHCLSCGMRISTALQGEKLLKTSLAKKEFKELVESNKNILNGKLFGIALPPMFGLITQLRVIFIASDKPMDLISLSCK